MMPTFQLTPPDAPRVHRSAVLSPCGAYRYALTRTWDESLPDVVWVMLNPSTADATRDDPTVRRCVAFARAWGRGGVLVVNLFAWRATSPDVLVEAHRRSVDVVGPDNDSHLLDAARGRDLVVAAWGARGALAGRAARVRELLRGGPLALLRRTKSGEPEHPLYLPGALTPQPLEGPLADATPGLRRLPDPGPGGPAGEGAAS